MRNKVVFPEPEGPNTEISSPSRTCRLKFWIAQMGAFRPARNDLEAFWSVSSGMKRKRLARTVGLSSERFGLWLFQTQCRPNPCFKFRSRKTAILVHHSARHTTGISRRSGRTHDYPRLPFVIYNRRARCNGINERTEV